MPSETPIERRRRLEDVMAESVGTMPSEKLDLDELTRLRDAASPLPWGLGMTLHDAEYRPICNFPDTDIGSNNEDYIHAAVNAVPALVSRIAELEHTLRRHADSVPADLLSRGDWRARLERVRDGIKADSTIILWEQADEILARIAELEAFIERLAEKILAAHEVLANRAEKKTLPARAGN